MKYQTLYLDLKQSAEAAEQLDVCVEVLRGTIDLDESLPDKPIYRILCRKADGRSYNEMVDGVTKETLTTRAPIIVELTEEEKEAIRVAEEARLEEERKKRKQLFWQSCFDAFETKTALMIEMEKITPDSIEPTEYDGQVAEFQWDFNAQTMSGAKLQYRAACIVSEDEPAVLTLKPRR